MGCWEYFYWILRKIWGYSPKFERSKKILGRVEKSVFIKNSGFLGFGPSCKGGPLEHSKFKSQNLKEISAKMSSIFFFEKKYIEKNGDCHVKERKKLC